MRLIAMWLAPTRPMVSGLVEVRLPLAVVVVT
jgi:hypothetical protein